MARRPRQLKEGVVRRQLMRRAHHAQGGLCFHCQQPFPLEAMTADHYPTPRYAGGKTRADNIVAACAPCNNERNQETNRIGKEFSCVVGDDTPRSPFEILKKSLHNS
jgi:5-methylcytosine-specific restriction endonuclease McrA